MKLGKRSGGCGSRHPRRPAEARPAGAFALPASLVYRNRQQRKTTALPCDLQAFTTVKA